MVGRSRDGICGGRRCDGLIARFWSAHTTRALAPAYAEHLRSHVLPKLHALDGYTSAMLLEREGQTDIEPIVVTFWQSLDAIRAFSGPDLETAVVEDAAVAVLSEFDRRVRHYEIILQDGRQQQVAPS